MKKRIISVLLVAALVITAIPAVTANEDVCDTCGEANCEAIAGDVNADGIIHWEDGFITLRYSVNSPFGIDVDGMVSRCAALQVVPNSRGLSETARLFEAAYKIVFYSISSYTYPNCTPGDCGCEYCDDCDGNLGIPIRFAIEEHYGGVMMPTSFVHADFFDVFCLCGIELGDVDGNGRVQIVDALEVVKYVVSLPSAIDDCYEARFSALITDQSIRTNTIRINDALEIVRNVVNLPSALD